VISAARVSVAVPARLHLGLLDLNGGLGRRFGSFGLTLGGPMTRLSLERAQDMSVEGPEAARARAHLETIVAHFGLEGGLRLRIEEAIPAHTGLGSGTQLALAVGMAACALAGIDVPPREVARLLGRGQRSGIGIGAFEEGGVLLDGGKGPGDAPPPIVARVPFPDAWRVLLIFDRQRGGKHGAEEVAAFARLPVFPAERVGHLCRLVLLSALPALIEQDVEAFGAAVTELQRVVGDHFAPAQGGRYLSPLVSEVLAWLEAEGVTGFGQSSWGPTGFAILGSPAAAERFLAAARDRWGPESGLDFVIERGRNRSAEVTRAAARPALAAGP